MRTAAVEAGELAKDAALRRVEDHAPRDWMRAARNAISDMRQIQGEGFTSDDIWAYLRCFYGLLPPDNRRAMGAALRNAQRDGLIEPTGRWLLSERPACHRRPVREWRRVSR